MKVIKVAASVLKVNDTIALENQAAFRDNNVFVVNVMGSPGAGKTSLLLRTIEALKDNIRIGVIEGDIATSHDAELIQATGVPVVQINTEGACHLDAMMIKMALTHFNLAEIDLLFIENVGNLVCPAGFRLGENARVVVSSVPEGDDKPKKYPGMFRIADGVVLNKIDLLHAFEFNINTFKEDVRRAGELPIFEVSCKTKDGLSVWLDWLGVKKK
ncbi:hydrogenase accessory protein HypB [Candidatus Desantisbacteria bacterium CG2_30_40_21]|uniref:Hydrogenase accessory protein HypB n=5 Tax=unclassified Candidatus Desantisiibacteriota TaxID=3106372 RepID=A0A2M7JBS0_9BACT|nr:MAG: hydrogenase accessory protein HypB [Candidatus Desantisbacteria bacterium CG2_30_40_21]PIP41476.1 MAG: hydrogenase accessory protein HypB [Candidatus Desantisbacteria bacterium CG23_combo_of_CG06-09_8_20_14_all_40_23]PIX16870.1 MAG: hydrogenase accessory protein HypB [Candidatus Desantisbacteria bacterium CG_4_8_14_3_um_filter_40_12]PIY19363.1 MAG: hydrogenase accessory protein HypB [Candidatus Desantisbacteria bacterium CG_4_10_14_3_um_filter_40_18]PJB29186.1 MAG: hydrogenase accessory